MNWRIQSALAGILAVLGLFVIFNPVTVVTAAASYIPWLLLFAGGIQYLSILLRSRRLVRLIIVPAVTGTLLVYAGLSMKFGDSSTVGPISLIFVLALLLFGSGAAKLFMASAIKKSKYFNFVLGSGVLSALIGLIVLFNWSNVSAGLIGVVLGLELMADAVAMAALALRDRDGEEAMEAKGLDPVAEAEKAAAADLAAKAEALAVYTPVLQPEVTATPMPDGPTTPPAA
jgi:membrane protein HdeD